MSKKKIEGFEPQKFTIWEIRNKLDEFIDIIIQNKEEFIEKLLRNAEAGVVNGNLLQDDETELWLHFDIKTTDRYFHTKKKLWTLGDELEELLK